LSYIDSNKLNFIDFLFFNIDKILLNISDNDVQKENIKNNCLN
jgi:hypothetical protein